ncbi:hypothetical protein [Leptospira sanjuanensis]|uniref:hypothetical protein n=1 Tax=Leptospira sanjuanensis TaxID=2879643 RepID=UPI001EE8D376|nr:hypothetical protein [Leptospira sanjuanensis]MCG6167188.1 hypothetical protein [Leptospira sanjuanensis]MCG6167200.1 hypothetical protein [Leptospira sanjuanensis]
MQNVQYTQGEVVTVKATGQQMIVDAQLGAFQVMCLAFDESGWAMFEMSLDQIEPFKD